MVAGEAAKTTTRVQLPRAHLLSCGHAANHGLHCKPQRLSISWQLKRKISRIFPATIAHYNLRRRGGACVIANNYAQRPSHTSCDRREIKKIRDKGLQDLLFGAPWAGGSKRSMPPAPTPAPGPRVRDREDGRGSARDTGRRQYLKKCYK
jgi:hypothetical protein